MFFSIFLFSGDDNDRLYKNWWNGGVFFHDSEKYEVKRYDWKRTNRMTDIITLLNKARKQNAALQNTWNIRFLSVENNNLIAYLKATDDLKSIVLIVVNLDQHSVQSGYVQLPLQQWKIEGNVNVKLHDVMTGERYSWTQEWNDVAIDRNKLPGQFFEVTLSESRA